MEIKKSLFSGGELDPALHDNVDIQAWRIGLAKTLNVHSGKNGRVVNDAGTYYLKAYDGIVKVCPVDGEDYVLIFYYDGTNGRVQAVNLDDYMDYANLSATKTFFAGGIITGYDTDAIPNLKFKTIKHNDDDKWLYVVDLSNSIKRYKFNGVTVTQEEITLEADVPDIEGVTETVATAADLALLTPLSAYEGHSVYVLSDGTAANRGWYTYTAGVWVQQTVNTIGDLTTAGYNDSKANWNAFTGATVQYGITLVTDKGEESPILTMNTYRPLGSTNTAEYTAYTKLPSTASTISSLAYTFNNIYFLNADYTGKVTHARIYRRPVNAGGVYGSATVAGAWGYVGDGLLSSDTPSNGSSFDVSYTEFNVQADYLNQPSYISQDLFEFYISTAPSKAHALKASGIGKYGARNVYWLNDKVLFSRVGASNNFLRNFPTDELNSFLLQVGTGDTVVKGIAESNGLIIFTDKGVYVGVNQYVSQADPRIKKAGDWILDSSVEPLVTTFGVLFIDNTSNTIRRLGFSDEQQEFIAQDIASLSSHFFYNKSIVSWTFKGGDSSKVVIILDDGTAVTMTYDERNKVFGFFRKETYANYVDAITYRVDGRELVLYTIEDDGIYNVEVESQRRPKNSFALNTVETVTFTHSTIVHPQVAPTFTGELKRNNVEDWDGELVIEATDIGTEIDNYFKCFNFETGESCLLKYIRVNDLNFPIFQPAEHALPESMRGSSVALYKATKTVTGLNHLEEEYVSVVADNSVVSSPNNPNNTDSLQVLDGEITLKDYACFILVGRPYLSDLETLQIDTDGNNTTLLKPKLVNKVVVKYDNSRGGFIGGKLPDEGVTDMDDAETWNYQSNINIPAQPSTVRKEYRLMSTWSQNGSIAFRQVDPLPIEIMSVILDVTGG